jgi:monoamine oxidase
MLDERPGAGPPSVAAEVSPTATFAPWTSAPAQRFLPAVPEELVGTASEGLPPGRQTPKRVIVIGAGIAGLVAGFELARQGHEPVILEAQSRVGGRVYTLRSFSPGLYAEAGAMRIPRVHKLTLAYCKLFGLELQPFIMSSARTFVYIAGKRMTAEDVNREPDRLDFDLSETERGRTHKELWDEATREIRDLYARDSEAALRMISEEYDRYSIRDFLKSRGLSDGAIELYGVMTFRETNLNAGAVEQLREIVGRAFEDMQEIVGGADLLPLAFYNQLKPCVRFGAQVVAVHQDQDSVTVHYRTRSGGFSERGDYAVCTLPFAVTRHLDFVPSLSRAKYRAIRELNYNPSTKILLQVRHRFWERAHGIIGGTTTTDLPIRRIVYPSHSSPDEERGVLLASYTWGQDAARWGSLTDEDRVALALKDVAKIHPEIVDEFEVGRSHAWYNDPYAGGAFALFEPGQQTALQADIVKPEGRIHFAGEHCSLWHAWIQGALESGIRAARAIHEAPEAPVTDGRA